MTPRGRATFMVSVTVPANEETTLGEVRTRATEALRDALTTHNKQAVSPPCFCGAPSCDKCHGPPKAEPVFLEQHGITEAAITWEA